MTNREFLMLAKTFNPDKDDPSGWYVSTKYDGQRCFWDGGISRGRLKKEIPWANQLKDGRYQEEVVCTGLWSRYGNVIHAPEWFLDDLPVGVMLDGELWMDRGKFQETRSIISTLVPGPGWTNVRFLVFEMPAPECVFKDGRINGVQFKKQIDYKECMRSYHIHIVNRPAQFNDTVTMLKSILRGSTITLPVVQEKLPYKKKDALDRLYDLLAAETDAGGEGLMLRNGMSYWDPSRTKFLLKVKPMERDEGIIVGYVWGLGKYDGLMGAATVEWNGKRFNVSGFTDAERRMITKDGKEASGPPGERVNLDLIYNPTFPIGTTINFKYASLTDAGIPREARHDRRT